MVFNSVKGRDNLVDINEAIKSVEMLYELIKKPLEDACINSVRPSRSQIQQIFDSTDLDQSRGLNELEFQQFYASVVTNTALSAAQGALKAYGLGIGLGCLSVFLIKSSIRSIPLVGLIAAPFLALAPTLILGPAVGTFGAYVYRKKGLEGVKEAIFGKGVKPKKG